MSKADILQELPKLLPEERQEIRARLNELDGAADTAWIDEGELTQEEKDKLDEALAQCGENPVAGDSWEQVEARLRANLR